MNPLVQRIASELLRREPACGRTRVVAIDGPSGAGKTTLSAELANELGAGVLRVDDFHQGWHGLESGHELTAGILGAIAVDSVGRAPSWNWETSAAGPDVVVHPSDVLIVEGVGAGSRLMAPYLSLLVWVEAPEQLRYERAIARDGDAYVPWWDTWADQEKLHFARQATRRRADLVVTESLTA